MKAYRSMVLVSSDSESIARGAEEVFQTLQSEITSFGLEIPLSFSDFFLKDSSEKT